MHETIRWNPESICLRRDTLDVREIAAEVYSRTCRTDFEAPGFCVVNVGRSLGSVAFRQLMVDIKTAMAALHEAQYSDTLVYLSAARFDQQESTKPHLDGGPEECFLMLGYEPSGIDSVVEIFDYAKCAFDLGLSPPEFMAKHNPMFAAGHELLRAYGTRIPCFANEDFQIVCINNSFAPYSPASESPANESPARKRWQGTLHTATIPTPDESKRRVINSTMIARGLSGENDLIDSAALHHFIHTSEVKRRGYDKQHLDDDR